MVQSTTIICQAHVQIGTLLKGGPKNASHFFLNWKFELMLLPKYFKFSSLIFVPYSDLSQAFLLKILTWALAGRTKKEEPKFFRTPSSFANWNNWPSGEPYFWKVNVRTLLEEQSFTWWGKIYIRNMKGVKQWKDLR